MLIRSAFLLSTISIMALFISGCKGQGNKTAPASNAAAGENIEFADIGIPENMAASDTSPGWKQDGQKILVTGTVYQPDGKTPAPGVIIYYYHTNTAGKYLHKPEEKRSMPPNEQGQTHGYIRGWMKTDANGRYALYTVRPGTYPSRDFPAHIHLTLKENGPVKEYYIDDCVFDDDRLLTSAYRQKMENRAGSGVLRMFRKGDLMIGERNMILGLNVPGYPKQPSSAIESGKNIEEDVFSFTPTHVWGPDKGTKTCPVCKYGWYQGILYFAGDKSDWNEIKEWLSYLERESIRRNKYLKVFFIYGIGDSMTKEETKNRLEEIGKSLKLEKLALTYVPSFNDQESDVYLNKINPEAESTFILYKRSRIRDKYINLKPTQQNFSVISQSLDNALNEYFDVPKQ